MVISAHAYPWDVIGDPAFVDRVRASEVDSVTLAACYHTTRAATPNHPSRKLVDVPYAALYRPVRAGIWGALEPRSFGEGDSFADACEILDDAGIPVSAWIVLTHNTRLGLEFPHLTVRNCFGENYPYALCPSRTEVVDYCVTLAAEAIRDAPIAGVSVESCGQMGLAHNSHHEKTDGAFTPLQHRLLSICCCEACGVPDSLVRKWFETDAPPDDEVLAIRHAAADQLRTKVLAAIREVAPRAHITLHGQADPWATGPSPGLTPTAPKLGRPASPRPNEGSSWPCLAGGDVDSVLMPCWPLDSTVTPDASAYVTTIGIDRERVHEHVRRLREDGAGGLALYHLGLTRDPAPLFASLGRVFKQ